jgi:hypothetical protein
VGIIEEQNRDGVSPTTIPSGWTAQSGLATAEEGGAPSPPNVLLLGSGSTPKTAAAFYETSDGNDGSVQVSAIFLALDDTGGAFIFRVDSYSTNAMTTVSKPQPSRVLHLCYDSGEVWTLAECLNRAAARLE